MAIPRSQQIDISSTPYYHCMTRCVRRTFLCGKDKESGRDYSHRKEWLVDRMKVLSEIFAINIAAYAVMSNHYHLVLHIDENSGENWDDDEIRERWKSLFPRDAEKLPRLEKAGAQPKVIEDTINLWRSRLMSISWFMRCLNEPIARRSNAEDEITGRFWEGRFKSQALLDEAAVLSAMVYVDLNPIRAGVSKSPENSEFTSIYDRIKTFSEEKSKKNTKTISAAELVEIYNSKQPVHLMKIKTINYNEDKDLESPQVDINLIDYIELVEFTGRHVRVDKIGYIPDSLKPILERLNVTQAGWMKLANNIEKGFVYAVGNELKLNQFNAASRQRKIRGLLSARQCYAENLK